MKKIDLIKVLEQYPDDMEIFVNVEWEYDFGPEENFDIKKVFFDRRDSGALWFYPNQRKNLETGLLLT